MKDLKIFTNNIEQSAKEQIDLLLEQEAFKECCKIETDDVITIVDMYFANEFSVEYIGKTLFD